MCYTSAMKKLATPFSNRQYMLKEDFELYYYSDKKAPQLSVHSHDYYEFYFFIEGEVSIEINGQAKKLSHGDLVLLEPGCPHRAIIEDPSVPYSRFVFWISDDFFMHMFSSSTSYGYLIQRVLTAKQHIFHHDRLEFNTIESKLFSLIEELSGDRFGKDERIRCLIMDLMLTINRAVYEHEHPVTVSDDNSLYKNLIIYIEQHLDDDISLEKLAKEFFVSKFYIEHLFKEQMGLSLHQFIIKKRLAKAKALILSGINIVNASEESGFSEYSAFYRAFVKEYGASPKEYRKLYSVDDFDKK